MPWRILVAPEGKNPGSEEGRNEGGMVIYLTNGGTRQEITRVAFERANSTHPETDFDGQMGVEMRKAEQALVLLDSLGEAAGTLQ